VTQKSRSKQAGFHMFDSGFPIWVQFCHFWGLVERIIANSFTDNRMRATWPKSRHLGQVAQVAAEKRGIGNYRTHLSVGDKSPSM
jgi:hypothetical protein